MYPFSISDHVIVTTTATDPDQGAERIAAALNRLLAENVVREGSAVRFFHEQSLGGISRRLMQPWFFGVGGSVGTFSHGTFEVQESGATLAVRYQLTLAPPRRIVVFGLYATAIAFVGTNTGFSVSTLLFIFLLIWFSNWFANLTAELAIENFVKRAMRS